MPWLPSSNAMSLPWPVLWWVGVGSAGRQKLWKHGRVEQRGLLESCGVPGALEEGWRWLEALSQEFGF